MASKLMQSLLDERLWECAEQDDAQGVRYFLKECAISSYRPKSSRANDLLLHAIASGSGSVIPMLLRAHPPPPFPALNAAIGNLTLPDAIVLKVVDQFTSELDKKHKGQLPLHAALGRKTPAIAEFLLSKRKVRKAASATYKGLNALETLLSRTHPLGSGWGRVVRTLIELGQTVRSKTQINEQNRALLDMQLSQLANVKRWIITKPSAAISK